MCKLSATQKMVVKKKKKGKLRAWSDPKNWLFEFKAEISFFYILIFV